MTAAAIVRVTINPVLIQSVPLITFYPAVMVSGLIDDLLDLTRIMSGKLHLNPVPVELSDSIRAALDAIQPSAAAKHLHITVDFEPGAAIVQADPTRLQQILWNLLTNAVKFTAPSGHIRIAVRHEAAASEVVVSDSGTGIAPALLPFVFEPFRQADEALRQESAGLGLGLAVVKQLAEVLPLRSDYPRPRTTRQLWSDVSRAPE